MKRKMDLERRSTLWGRLQVYLTMVQSQSVFVVLVFISTTEFINKLYLLTQYNNFVILNRNFFILMLLILVVLNQLYTAFRE